MQESRIPHIYGPVAQWIRHLTTNQGIPGSTPGRVALFNRILTVRVTARVRVRVTVTVTARVRVRVRVSVTVTVRVTDNS